MTNCQITDQLYSNSPGTEFKYSWPGTGEGHSFWMLQKVLIWQFAMYDLLIRDKTQRQMWQCCHNVV